MYHQFAFSGVTIGDTDYGDEAPKRKAESSENAMRPLKTLTLYSAKRHGHLAYGYSACPYQISEHKRHGSHASRINIFA